MAVEKQNVWQNQKRENHRASLTMSSSEISRNIYNIFTHIENQSKRVPDLECAAYDSAPASFDDYKYINILGYYNRNNKDVGRQPHISKRPKKLLIDPYSGKKNCRLLKMYKSGPVTLVCLRWTLMI